MARRLGLRILIAGTMGALGCAAPSTAATPRSRVVAPPPAAASAMEREGAKGRTPPSMETLDAIEAAVMRGFFSEAEAALGAWAEGSEAGRAYLLRARIALETTRFEEVDRFIELAAARSAAPAAVETLRGEALEQRGELEAALGAYQKALRHDASYRARVRAGLVLGRQGRSDEAERMLLPLIDAYNEGAIAESDGESLAYVAMAARALGSPRDASEAFQKATRADPNRVETQLEWAELFFEKYDLGRAEESLRQALSIQPNSPRAEVLLARILIERSFDFPQAEAAIERALATAPRTKAAYSVRAGMAIREGRVELARVDLERALAIDPTDPEAWSLEGALALLEGDEPRFDAVEKEVLGRNPRASRFYTTVAEILEFEHRYPTIVRLARRATAIQPNDGLAWATLGINLLRLGDEREGLVALKTAWRKDRYHVQVFNLLNLYDDVIAKEYEDVRSPPFVFRFHREEKEILTRYVPRTLEKAYESMKARYGAAPDGPIRLEMYGDPEHFAVRTIGLPRLGVQGVCFGNLVTAISPRGGPFNWGQITWHELAHVFHIHLSKHRVPRWFTEGLAEYETNIARKEWRRELDHRLQRSLERGELPPLAGMNRAFTSARSPEALSVAYDASARIVTFLVERYGFPAIVAMLRGWGDGLSTEDVFRRALGAPIAEVDAAFRTYLRDRLAPWAGQVSIELDPSGDRRALRRAAEASVARGGDPGAHLLLGTLDLADAKLDDALRHVEAIWRSGRDGYDVQMLASRIHLAKKNVPAARVALRRATELDGTRAEAWLALSLLAERDGDRAAQREALSRLARIEEHDRAISASLLPLLFEAERYAELVEFGEMALLLDPARSESHRWLAEAYLRTGRYEDALFEFDSAALTGGDRSALVLAGRAVALAKLGRRREAREAARQAIALDPSTSPRLESILRAP